MKKLLFILLFAYCLLPIAYCQTTVTKIVDPGGTGDYTSLQAWASDRAGNLITRNTIEVARCICTNGQPDTYASITSFTTDANHYIKIYADTNYNGINYRHHGIYPVSGNIYRIEYSPTLSPILQITTSKFIVEGICIKDILPDSNYAGNCIQVQDADAGGTIGQCILLDVKTSTLGNVGSDEHGHGIRTDAVSKYSKYYIRDNIFIGFNDVNQFAPINCGILTYPTTDSEQVFVDNNTFYSCKFGIWNRGGESGYDSCRVYMRNNLFQNPTADMYGAAIYCLNCVPPSQYPILTNNVILPNSTPLGTINIPNSGFTDGSEAPFIYGDTSSASLALSPVNSPPYSLYVTTGWDAISLNTAAITGLQTNTYYTLSFYAAWGWSGAGMAVTVKTTGGTVLTSINTPTSNGGVLVHQTVSFNSGSNTSVVLYITGGGTSASAYFDDFSLYSGNGTGNAYFVDPANNDFHLKNTAVLAIGQGTNLSSDANDPFNLDIDHALRPATWDVGADQFGAGNVDTTTPPPDTATSTACVDYSPWDAETNFLKSATEKISFNYIAGFFTAYKVFSPNFFTFIQKQDYPLFTHVVESSGNIYMNGQVVIPQWNLPMEAIVSGANQDSINVVQGIPFTGTSADTSNHSIELRSVPGGEAGVAQKIQTIIGQGKTEFYARWKMYVPSDYECHKDSWNPSTLIYAYQSFFYIVDSTVSSIFQLKFQQDTTTRDNIKLVVDTVTTLASISRGAAVNIQIHYKLNNAVQIWIGSSQVASLPDYTLPYAPTTTLNNEVVFGLGWSESGSSPIYIDDITISNGFISDNYATAPIGTYLWGNYDQEASSTILYGGNMPTIGLADSCLAHGVKPIISIGGWPGQFNGLDTTAGVTRATSNTPWNYAMKDTTSLWTDYNNISHNSGLRGHWIYNLIKWIEKNKYDGADFDFEFVGLDTIGLAAKYQAKLFPDLLQAVRQSFDTAGHSGWFLSFDSPTFYGNTYPDTAYSTDTNAYGHYYYTGTDPLAASADTILFGNFDDRWMDFKRIYSIVDMINLMCYGDGAIYEPTDVWFDPLWKNPPGISPGNTFSMDYVDSIVVARGYPKKKTAIGFGFYGNVWLHNSDLWQSTIGLYENNSNGHFPTWGTVITIGDADLLYPHLNDLVSPNSSSILSMGAVKGWCNTFAQPFIKYNNSGNPIAFAQCGVDSLTGFNPAQSDNFIITLDDSLSTMLKMRWTYQHGYAGIFIWEITQDFEPTPTGLRPVLEDDMLANLSKYVSLPWRHITIKKHTPLVDTLVLISPIKTTTDRQPLFYWHSIHDAVSYNLQVAADTSFASPVINLITNDTSYASMLNQLSFGLIYYWRVRVNYSIRQANWVQSTFNVWADSTLHMPATVQIGTVTSNANGTQFTLVVPWNVWALGDSSKAATNWKLYLNGVYVKGGNGLTIIPYLSQSGTDTAIVNWGNYTVNIVLNNSYGESQDSNSIFTGSPGTPMKPDIAGINILCDRPLINSDSNGWESDVIVIDEDSTYNFYFHSIGATTPSYTVITKDTSFLTIRDIIGNVLTLNANRGGLTGLEIKENQTCRIRYVGLAVRENGSVPKFPPYVAIGNVTQYYTASLPFYEDIRNGNADDNKRIDIGTFYYAPAYLNNGILDLALRTNLRFGIQPSFVWYGIDPTDAGGTAIHTNFNDSTFLKAYYLSLMNLMQHCDSVLNGVPINLIIEPDMIGYLKGSYPSTYLTSGFNCDVFAAYSAGVLTNSDSTFPNNLTGFCKSLNYIIKKYNSNASIGWAFPMWACTHNSGKGIMHATDVGYSYNLSGVYSVGRNLIQGDYYELSSISLTLGLNYMTDWISIEGYGYDGAIDQDNPVSTNWTNPSTTDWFWNAQYYDNLMLACNIMSSSIISGGTGLPIILGGDGGHINSTLTESPTIYNSNNQFPDLTNSGYQWEDAASDYFFGDTMYITGTNRLSYFSIKPPADSNDVIVSGNSVIWNQHITYAKNNGVIALIMGAGMTLDTHNLPDPNSTPSNIPTDNYWWITKVQRYYKNPVMR